MGVRTDDDELSKMSKRADVYDVFEIDQSSRFYCDAFAQPPRHDDKVNQSKRREKATLADSWGRRIVSNRHQWQQSSILSATELSYECRMELNFSFHCVSHSALNLFWCRCQNRENFLRQLKRREENKLSSINLASNEVSSRSLKIDFPGFCYSGSSPHSHKHSTALLGYLCWIHGTIKVAEMSFGLRDEWGRWMKSSWQ